LPKRRKAEFGQEQLKGGKDAFRMCSFPNVEKFGGIVYLWHNDRIWRECSFRWRYL